MARRLLKICCGLLALTLELFLLGVALASGPWSKDGVAKNGLSGQEVYVFTYNLDVFENPTKKSEVLEIVPFAKRILFIAEKKGWAKVYTTNGRLGFCNAKQLTESNPNNYEKVVYCQVNRAPYYLRPSTDSPILGHLDRNEKTTLFAITPKHDWMRIRVGDYYGYIQRPYIDFDKYDSEKQTDAWVNVESVPIYYDIDVDTHFTTAYFGQHLYIVSQENGWAKIHSETGLIGYCKASALSELDPNSLDIPVYTQLAGSFLFESSTDLSGHRSVAANVEMLLSAVDDELHWARVRYDDRYYYVPYVFLGTEPRRGDYKLVRAATDISIREGTTQASKIITNVPAGTTLMLVGCTDNCAKVATQPDIHGSRFIGFVKIEDIQ